MLGYWSIFIKSEQVKSSNLVVFCQSGNRLNLETFESDKYISNVNAKLNSDTLFVTVWTTTVQNPFAKRHVSASLMIPVGAKFVVLANKCTMIGELSSCSASNYKNL